MPAKKRRILFLIFLSMICFILAPLPIHRLTHLQIKNDSGNSNAQLQELTKKYLSKNIFSSYLSIFFTPLHKRIASIKSYQLKLDYPHRLIIHIVEKQPWISIYSEGDSINVANDGCFLNQNNDHPMKDPSQLIIIKNLPKEVLKAEYLSKDYLQTFHAIVNAINESFPSQSFQLEPYKWGQWILWLEDQIPIYLNSDTKTFKNQLKRTSFILQKNKKEPQYIDLRIPKKVIIRYG